MRSPSGRSGGDMGRAIAAMGAGSKGGGSGVPLPGMKRPRRIGVPANIEFAPAEVIAQHQRPTARAASSKGNPIIPDAAAVNSVAENTANNGKHGYVSLI